MENNLRAFCALNWAYNVMVNLSWRAWFNDDISGMMYVLFGLHMNDIAVFKSKVIHQLHYMIKVMLSILFFFL